MSPPIMFPEIDCPPPCGQFDLVVAASTNNFIGGDSYIPWTLKSDLAHFRRVTTARPSFVPDSTPFVNVVIMGRITYQSLPDKFRPLPGRLNIVLTRGNSANIPDHPLVRKVGSLDCALNLVQELRRAGPLLTDAGPVAVGSSFVIGGGEIYALAFQHPARRLLFLTRVKVSIDVSLFTRSAFIQDVDTYFTQLKDKTRQLPEEGGLESQVEMWLNSGIMPAVPEADTAPVASEQDTLDKGGDSEEDFLAMMAGAKAADARGRRTSF
ncbi:hypothetical protein H696_02989 [Fonticula alba]|uniref:dihydrofolate reductase n=1 Tax=Fonticula alba TaxID=691883 RepID=A0A058ZB29_FONAL|nr:hypothetical protein H696_02989 [Fonticula alba]KCV70632.1 hypothetical protein H696_02989 [Fonticula alba]|eukprot:XP_009495148.1 hypothetical protein H696_02989 [Fonticula alba]